MPIRSMTGFAQVRGEVQRQNGNRTDAANTAPSAGRLAFALSLKSVNHRFLDLHFRLPSGTDSLEMQLRRLLKEKMARGHVEVSLSLERAAGETFVLNLENSVLAYTEGVQAEKADASFTLARSTLDEVIAKQTSFPEAVGAGKVKVGGNPLRLAELMGLMNEFPRMFEIVEPKRTAVT